MNKFENIPVELRKLKQWVCWQSDKTPRNAKTGQNAQSNNPATWSTYEEAIAALDQFGFDGIGFMFANGYFGVDIDNAIGSDDEIVSEFITALQSYTEISRSGTGIHVICKGELPDGSRRRGKVEMYQSGRYFIMTGDIFNNNGHPFPIRDCTEAIKPLHAKYLGGVPEPCYARAIAPANLNDFEVLEKAENCASGGMFSLLNRGDWKSLYNSQSEADLAFCNHLAFWTQKDPVQMDRIFRSSGLMREKWDRKQSGTTYGNLTIQKAISGTVDVYDPIHGRGEVLLHIGGGGRAEIRKPRKNFDYTDTGNALRFVDAYGEIIRYSHQKKRWLFWDGKVWNDDLTGEIKKLADKLLIDMKKEAFEIEDESERKEFLKWVTRTASASAKANMIQEAQHIGTIPVISDELDRDKDLLNCRSGIVNMRNGELIRHDPNYLMTKISYAEYNPNETREPERWLQFLAEVTNGDKELIHYLQKAIGYSLTGSIKEQAMFFCYGTGNNGKSTFLDIVSALAGSYGCNAQPETIMISKSPGAVNQDIARLAGARFVTTVEPNDGVKLNEGLVKQLTGGDRVTARFLYGLEFEFVPQFKLWLGANHKPVIRGTDVGIWRRIHLIPFLVQIPPAKVDKSLKHKLLSELPLIMKWAIEGVILWQKEGLDVPDSVKHATDEYRAEMDILAQFCELCVEPCQGASLSASELYEAYTTWAQENHEYQMSNQKFGREFCKKYPEKTRTGIGWIYKNVRLTAYAERLDKNTRYGVGSQYDLG